MKPLHLGLAGILSGLLLGFSYLPWSPILTAFVAIVPLLWAMRKSQSLPMMATALLANLIAFGMADWELWQRMGLMGGTAVWLLEASIMTLPWALGHLIFHRHNPKLGYIAFVTTWLMLEWILGQYLGAWQGIQLGMASVWLPALVQWYSFLGVTGGTMWLLTINIQLYRYFWPAEAHTRKSALYSGLAVLFLPMLLSGGMYMLYPTKSETTEYGVFAPSPEFHQPKELTHKAVLFTNTDGKGAAYFQQKYPHIELLAGEGQGIASFFYKIGNDTLKQAILKRPHTDFETLRTKHTVVSSIMGMEQRHWFTTDWAAVKTGMLNTTTLLRSEAVRLYAKQGNTLICAFSAPQKMSWLARQRQQANAIARALEVRRHLVFSTFDGEVLSVASSGDYKRMKVSAEVGVFTLSAAENSFFSNYGDLTGRLSIFVSIWLALGTIVKPYRKK